MHLTALALLAVSATALAAQSPEPKGVVHGRRPSGRLAIRNALVIQGNGTPAEGPYDVVVDQNRIVEMVPLDPVALKTGRAKRPEASAEIDGSGKYLLPG